MEAKKQIRTIALKKRAQVPAADHQQWDREIHKRLYEHPFFIKSETVLCYLSLPDEVGTDLLISECLQRGKKVYIPKVCQQEMVFYRLRALDQVTPGHFGVREPLSREAYQGEDSLVITPLLAFDKMLRRLGYGGGYYDRFFASHKNINKIGLAYELQKIERVPTDARDVPLDLIFTQKEMYECVCN